MTAPSRLHLLGFIGLLWLLVFAAYSNSFGIPFQFDDTHTIQSNPYIRSLSNIPRFFVDSKTYSYRPENSGYRPMSSVAAAVGFAISQQETWGYHLLKLLEHCIAATMVLLIGLRLLPRKGLLAETRPCGRFAAAALGALVFALHRANTETVNYISAVSTLQAGMFFSIAFYLYLRFREDAGAATRPLVLALSVLCYMLGNLSKEEGITLPAMLLLYEWILRKKREETYLSRLRDNLWPWSKRIAPYVVAAVVFVALRTMIQPPEADLSRGDTPTFVYFITQFRSWLYYWYLFFFPINLNADNLSFDFSQSLADMRVWGALGFHCCVWWAAWAYGKRHRFVLFAVAWIYITVLPASSVFPLVEAVNEHRMYIPYMLLSLLSSWLLLSVSARRPRFFKAGVGFGVCLALTLGVGAHQRNTVWQSKVSLWEDILAKNPESTRAMNVLGISLIQEDKVERALELLERCYKNAPTYLPCMVHLSMGYAKLKRYEEGRKVLEYAVSLQPNYAHTNFHLGVYYKEYFNRPNQALEHLGRVRQVTSGRFYQATLKMAEIYVEQGRYAEAVGAANEVLDLDQTNGEAWTVQARARMLHGDVAGAKRVYARLLPALADSVKVRLDYGHLLERQADLQGALAQYSEAARLDPTAVQAWQGVERAARAFRDGKASAVAQRRLLELQTTGKWTFYPSLMLPGEKPGQNRPRF